MNPEPRRWLGFLGLGFVRAILAVACAVMFLVGFGPILFVAIGLPWSMAHPQPKPTIAEKQSALADKRRSEFLGDYQGFGSNSILSIDRNFEAELKRGTKVSRGTWILDGDQVKIAVKGDGGAVNGAYRLINDKSLSETLLCPATPKYSISDCFVYQPDESDSSDD